MFTAWVERQTIQHVATTCQVARATVRKYREMDGWDERLVLIQHNLKARQDETIEQMKSRQVRYIRGTGLKILEAIFGPNLDGKGGRSFYRMEPKDLIKALIDLNREERVIRGEVSDRLEILERLQKRFKERQQADGQ